MGKTENHRNLYFEGKSGKRFKKKENLTNVREFQKYFQEHLQATISETEEKRKCYFGQLPYSTSKADHSLFIARGGGPQTCVVFGHSEAF